MNKNRSSISYEVNNVGAGSIRRPPRVSVIMPSYNHAPFVGIAIESILSQSFEDIECIITDDGSTDGSAEIIRSFTDARVNAEIFPANVGANEAANHCLSRARGEYVAILNSDDAFLPGKLTRQVDILDSTPELGAVFGLATFIDEAGAPIPDATNPFLNMFTAEPADRYAWLRFFFFRGNALCHPTVMIRKRIYDELGAYDVRLRQLPDMDMWVRLCAHYPIVVLPEPLTAFRVLSGQRNTSAPSPTVIRRHVWEQSRILRRFRTMPDATLERAFRSDIPRHIAERGLPVAVQLALTAATVGPLASRPVQLFALETLEDALARGIPGIRPRDLHRLTGALDPFGIALDAPAQRASKIGSRSTRGGRKVAPHLTAIASDAVSGRNRFTIPIRALIERGAATGNVHLASDLNLGVTPFEPILIQRHLTLPPEALAVAKQSHCRLVHDLDDLLWSIPDDDPEAGVCGAPVLAAMDRQLARADVITVSTVPLAAALRARGFEPVCLPNVVEPRDWLAAPQRAQRTRLRIGWCPRRSLRSTELAVIEHVLRALSSEVDFVVLGDVPAPLAELLRCSECYVSVPPALFPALFAALDLDVVLEPLASNAFTECKSNLRLLQAGMLAYPVIASDVEPHRGLPVTLVSNAPAAWISAVRDRLHETTALRDEGERLRRAVHEEFLAADWVDRYLAAWTGASRVAVHA